MLLGIAITLLPLITAIAAWRSSSHWGRRLAVLPALMWLVQSAFIFTDQNCDGDGFRQAWANCDPAWVQAPAQKIASLLYTNLFAIVTLLPIGLIVLAIIEWRARSAARDEDAAL